MGQYFQYCLKGFNSGFRASRQIQDQALSSHSADAPAQGGQWRFGRAGDPHFFWNTIHSPLYDCQSGLRCDVPGGDPRTANRDHQVYLTAAISELLLDPVLLVGKNGCPAYMKSGG